jgi:hypothetical protein
MMKHVFILTTAKCLPVSGLCCSESENEWSGGEEGGASQGPALIVGPTGCGKVENSFLSLTSVVDRRRVVLMPIRILSYVRFYTGLKISIFLLLFTAVPVHIVLFFLVSVKVVKLFLKKLYNSLSLHLVEI